MGFHKGKMSYFKCPYCGVYTFANIGLLKLNQNKITCMACKKIFSFGEDGDENQGVHCEGCAW